MNQLRHLLNKAFQGQTDHVFRKTKKYIHAIIMLLLVVGFMDNPALHQSRWTVIPNGSVLAADISYVYDAVGRLSAVIDPAGDTALYTYDDMGNLLAITRQSSAQVAIFQVTPESGSAGTTVRIAGTGFSPTPAQNTVAFNGTSATVLSSTITEIVTTVSVGATTGTLSVTTSSGSDTSPSSFTVHGDQAPTISNFSPSAGSVGNSVTVTGTNFHTTAGTNKVRFNRTQALVSTATSTSLTTTVPHGAGSGPLTITTPMGQVVSSNDFFVAPPPFSAPDVLVMDRTTIGATNAYAFGVPDKIGLIVFDGVAGQQVSWNLDLSGLTIDVHLYDPFGQDVLISNVAISSARFFVDKLTLPMTGTYTLAIETLNSTIGSTTVTSYVVMDSTGTITVDGPSVPVSNTIPGQNMRLMFSGTASQSVSTEVTGSTFGAGTQIHLEDPAGQVLASTSFNGTTGTLATTTLSSTGTYTIVVDPLGDNLGSGSVTLSEVPPDLTGTIIPNGPSVTLDTTAPGQNAFLTFTGTANQRVSLAFTNSGGNTQVTILNPDGSNLVVSAISTSIFLEPKILPTSGTYTIFIDPSGSVLLTNAVVTLYDVPANITGPIAINGPSVPITLTAPGQNAALTFDGSTNLEVTVAVSGNTINPVRVSLKRQDGTTLTSRFTGVASFSLTPQILPATETYSITVDPNQAVTGTLTVSLTGNDTTAPILSAVTAIGITGTTVTIQWDTDEPADSQVDYGTTTAYGSSSPLDANLVTAHSIGLTGLMEATLYHYRVHSRDASWNLTTSGDHTFSTGAGDTTPPTAPATLTATPHGTDATIDLSWAAATDNVGVTGYEIERCQGSGCSSFAPLTTVGGLAYSDTGLNGTTSYSYRVRAIDAAGNQGPWSPIASATTASTLDMTPPTAPPTFSGIGVSTSQIDLAWGAATDNVGVTGYEVWQCQGNGCTNFAPIALVTGLSYSDTGLAKGTRYRYQVRATDAAGNWSGFSPIASVRTKNK